MQSERAILGSGVRGAQRLEAELRAAVEALPAAGAPARLAAAVGDALFPGGQRLRPRLLLAICAAEGGQDIDFAFDAAVAVECVHAASLAHDDLPCFDDADLRRGKPTIHKRYDEATALLVGDGLLTLAFERLAASEDPRAIRALRILLRATGLHGGLIAGQGWELEPSTKVSPDESAVRRYHAGKTSGLFAAAAGIGALAAGADTTAYTALGYRIGGLYQSPMTSSMRRRPARRPVNPRGATRRWSAPRSSASTASRGPAPPLRRPSTTCSRPRQIVRYAPFSKLPSRRFAHGSSRPTPPPDVPRSPFEHAQCALAEAPRT